MINLVKKNIIKFVKIISFLFKQINIGDNKINNFWILLKKSLTIWVIPVFFISFLFNQYSISNKYTLLVLIIYTAVIIANYLKNNFFVFVADRLLLILLSFLICTNNKITADSSLLVVLVLSVCFILTIYISLFFYYNKRGELFILNFSKLNCFMEFMLVLFVLIFGINSSLVFNMLFVLMTDIIYKILILSVILNLKKRFSIQQKGQKL